MAVWKQRLEAKNDVRRLTELISLPAATGYTLVTSPSFEIRAIFRSGMLMIRRRLNFREKTAMEPVNLDPAVELRQDG